MAEPVEVLRAAALEGVVHGFLGRRGGVSTGAVAGLNVGLGAGDEPAAVAENRRSAASSVLPGAPLATVYQVHSPDAVVTRAAWPDAERPHADALVTDRPGLLLGIVTADCAPVLLADPEAGVVGAAHAGWKGALGDVAENTVEAMLGLGARRERILAAVGPAIAQPSYEVDQAFIDRFLAADEAYAHFFGAGREGHGQFDLAGFVAARLASTGIRRVEIMPHDTYREEDRFFSFRRATHRGEATYGRQISLIAAGHNG